MHLVLTKRSSQDIPFGLIYGTIAMLALIAARVLPIRELLPSCMFKAMTELPCPTCGTTRLMTNLAHGDLATAFSLNPAVVILIISSIGLFLYDSIVLLTGSRLSVNLSHRESQTIRFGAVAALLLNWTYIAVTL